MKTVFKYLSIFFLFVMPISCTETIELDQLYISLSSYTFDSGTDVVRVDVSANVEWTIENDNEWISVDASQCSVLLTASANESDEPREGIIRFVANDIERQFQVYQLSKSYTGKFVEVDYATSAVFSKNGRFHAGVKTELLQDGATTIATPVVIDSYTGEMTEYDGDADYETVRAISDDGRIFSVTTYSGGSVVFVDGTPTRLEVEGCNKWVEVEGMSSDGSIMVGYAQDSETKLYVPVKWTNMQPEILEHPDVSAIGQELYNGSMARGCSEDGSVIYGSEWDTYGLIFWKDGKMYYPGKDFAKEKTILVQWGDGSMKEFVDYCVVQILGDRFSMSPNGKYIAAMMNDFVDYGPDSPSGWVNYAAVIDTEKYELLVVKGDFKDITALTVDNNGICYAGTPSELVSQGYVFDCNGFPENPAIIPAPDWLKQKYGIEVNDNRLVTGVSSNNNIIYGWKFVLDGAGFRYLSWYYIVDTEVK